MRAWTLCKKDLTIYTRDRVGLLLGLGLPLVLALVFGAAMGNFGDGDEGMGRAKLYVEDRDGTDASRELVEALSKQDGLRVVSIPTTEEGYETARERVADGDGPAGILIDVGYAASVAAGEEPRLVLYRDPGKMIEQQIIAGNLLPALFESSSDSLGRRAMKKTLDLFDFPEEGRARADSILDASWGKMDDLVRRLEEEGVLSSDDPDSDDAGDPSDADAPSDSEDGFDFASAITDMLGLSVEDVVGTGDDGDQQVAQQSHAVAGIAVMMLLFGLIACGGTLLEEEAEGTLDRLRLSPGTPSEILAGKYLFTWIVGMTQLVLLFVVTSLIFPIPIFDAPVALLVLSAAVAAAATAFGILFATLARSRKQLEGLSTIVVLSMSAFGGSWWPLMMTPEWYQKLGHLTLNAWAMDGYQGIFWYGKGLGGILLEIGVLIGIAVCLSFAAVVTWKRRLRIA